MKIYSLMRPEKIYKDIIRQREIDGTNFYNKYKNDFVNVNCPACGNKGKLLFGKYGFKHKLCGKCKTIFCSPRPSEKLLNIYSRKGSISLRKDADLVVLDNNYQVAMTIIGGNIAFKSSNYNF